MYITIDKNYEVKCTLGTIRDIEEKFSKPFYSIMAELDKLTTTEQIKLLYVGVRRADSSVIETDFVRICEDMLGLGNLTEYIEQFLMQLQYPGCTVEEVQQKLEKKLHQAELMRASAGMR